ncbi:MULTISPECIES: restriction endonuclease [unclassified Oceanobacillus]|uniref:restriction endonuclease n=1 Tax=unclassified Oceanobacillus TaxID=2630292 RepID=UPI0012EB6FB3|nr:restriction endonuclease [Oceanobacillus sp. AG]
MLVLELIIGLVLLAAFLHFRYTKRKHQRINSLIDRHIEASEELKKTLAMGLYLRFKTESAEQPVNYSSIYLKGNPISFESFVADLMKTSRGGSIWVSPSSNDQGVDFEHTTGSGLYLGQVKCYEEDLPFDPIALIHSNMVKRDAVGGYVITTGSFTENARHYAQGLNIELIDGVKLVEEWFASLRHSEEDINNLIDD